MLRPASAAASITKARIALVKEAMRTVPAGASRSARRASSAAPMRSRIARAWAASATARVGERDRPAVALEQRGAALALERGELLRHRRRAHRGRGRDGAHRPEALELDQQAKTAGIEHCSAELYSVAQKKSLDLHSRAR